jgi:hypothetical protein
MERALIAFMGFLIGLMIAVVVMGIYAEAYGSNLCSQIGGYKVAAYTSGRVTCIVDDKVVTRHDGVALPWTK